MKNVIVLLVCGLGTRFFPLVKIYLCSNKYGPPPFEKILVALLSLRSRYLKIILSYNKVIINNSFEIQFLYSSKFSEKYSALEYKCF